MRNPKFLRVVFEPENGRLENVDYVLGIANLLNRYRACLFDDFFGMSERRCVEKTIELIRQTAPAFWVVVDPKTAELAGIVYLYDWIGTPKTPYSAHVATCFERKYWGAFAYRAGRRFLRYVFSKYGLRKLKASIYSHNPLAARILPRLGFEKRFVSPSHTVVAGVATDLVNYEVEACNVMTRAEI